MEHTDGYIIEGGKEGKSRLNILADVMRPYTMDLLIKNGLTKGDNLLDVGCGGGHVSIMAAEIVGPQGKVDAVDFDREILALASEDARTAGISNVSFQQGSAYEINYNNEYDIAYSRFLLSHLQKPVVVLQKMLQSVKPGGKVVVEDIHFSGHFCYPACQAFNDYVNYFVTAAKHNGQDAEIGPRLVGLFQEAGIKEVGFDVVQPCFYKGGGKWMGYQTLDKIKNTLTQQGIVTSDQIAQMLQELEAYTNDETTIISLPRIFRVWGGK